MNKKGFTLIELMIVVVIISILAAVAIPGYKQIAAEQEAIQLLENGVDISSVKDDMVRGYMIKITEEAIAEDVKLNSLNREKSDTINTVKPVEVTKPVPQTVKDTVKPVFKPDFVITCSDRDGLMSKCTLNLNQRDVRYSIALSCEKMGYNEYKCEGF